MNTIPNPKIHEKRTDTEVQNKSTEICSQCILHETNISGLKIKNDHIRQQFYELEKENKMLKSQLDMHFPTTNETNNEISMECDQNGVSFSSVSGNVEHQISNAHKCKW